MPNLTFSAGLIAIACVGNALASTGTAAGWFDHSCQIPGGFSFGGCAVSCPADKLPFCHAGMSLWRGKAWSCSFQPTCACLNSFWDASRMAAERQAGAPHARRRDHHRTDP